MGKIENVRVKEIGFFIVWAISVFNSFNAGWTAQKGQGSGQRKLGRLLKQHPLVTFGQPGVATRFFNTYAEAWYLEYTKETERLHQAGVTEAVFQDSVQQVLLGDVNWARQTKVLTLPGDWLVNQALRWRARSQLVESFEQQLDHGFKFEHVVENYTEYSRINQHHRPLNGLVHLDGFRDWFKVEKMFDKSTRSWVTLYDIQRAEGLRKKYTAQQVRNYTSSSFERSLEAINEQYPNGKVIFLVRDPRSFIATRLKRAFSKQERRQRYYLLMKEWLQVNKKFISQCDKYQVCHLVRYEDLVSRPTTVIQKMLESFRYQRLYAPRFKFEVGQNESHLDSWNTTLPRGIEQIMIDEISILDRLGYYPNKLTEEQYRQEVDLRPKADPLKDIEISDQDMLALDDHLLSNMM